MSYIVSRVNAQLPKLMLLPAPCTILTVTAFVLVLAVANTPFPTKLKLRTAPVSSVLSSNTAMLIGGGGDGITGFGGTITSAVVLVVGLDIDILPPPYGFGTGSGRRSIDDNDG